MRLEQFRDQSGERRVVRQRLVIASVIIGLLFFGLVGQLIYLQVGQHEQLSARSQDNRVRIAPLSPTRGIIYDRNGEVLADNQAAFRLSVIPEQVDDMPALLSALDNLIGISAEERAAFAEARAQARHFQQIPLKSQLTEQQVGRLAVNRHRFPGVEVEAYLSRHYPYASTAAHVVGYVGRITRDELRQRDQRRYRGTSLIGKTGIERLYEHELRGTMGIEHIESNALGRSIRVLDRDPPTPGADIHLTLDIDLQQAAEQALGDFRGAIVALDPRDGAVLALASQPGFNPNALVQGIDREAFEQLSASPTQPLFNRALSGRYPPGSTIKPFLGLAGAASGHLDPNATMFCNGTYELPDVKRVWRDWKPEGHGRINLIQAVAQSCDIYYYDLAHRMGIDSMHQWMSEFGFGALTGIDLPGERAGIMPSREWKRATLDASWYRGETINTGIGQGFTLSTPIQLATSTAMLANRGRPVRPHLRSKRDAKPSAPETDRLTLDNEQLWQVAIDSMVEVVHGPRGTARQIAPSDYELAGKTGTAQVIGIGQDEEYDEQAIPERFHDHALFTAFAPAADPRIAVAVVVENGGSGSQTAAPMAKEVITTWLKQLEHNGDLALQ